MMCPEVALTPIRHGLGALLGSIRSDTLPVPTEAPSCSPAVRDRLERLRSPSGAHSPARSAAAEREVHGAHDRAVVFCTTVSARSHGVKGGGSPYGLPRCARGRLRRCLIVCLKRGVAMDPTPARVAGSSSESNSRRWNTSRCFSISPC